MRWVRGRWFVAGIATGILTLTAVGVGAEHFRAPVQGTAAIAEQPAWSSQGTALDAWSASDDPCEVGAGAQALSHAFRCAATRALPAVVHVQVETVSQAVPDAFRNSPFDDFFRQFPGLGEPQPEDQVRRGSGSGFIFRPDGYVLTNNHVVDGAQRVTVISQDREYAAEVVGRDPNTDIAVLKIDDDDLPVVEIGDSDPVQIGDWVVALGYPLQLGATVTSGIISATSRSIGILRQEGGAEAPLENFLQTDAAINPGNSGGPLVDLGGRVVGVNSAIASPTGFYSGYGFAIPINLAMRVADDLIEYGAVHRPRLGVRIGDPTAADVEVLGLDRARGAMVVQVDDDSPAARAGIELGDVIVAVDGETVTSVAQLQDRIARYEPGDRVQVELIRERAPKTVTVALGQFEAPSETTAEPSRNAPTGENKLGFQYGPLTPQLAQQLNLTGRGGVVITGIDPSSGAASVGIAAGMRIERINGVNVNTVEDVERAVANVRPGQAISMIVQLPDGTRLLRNFRTPQR